MTRPSFAATLLAGAALLTGCASVPDLGAAPTLARAADHATTTSFAVAARDWPSEDWWSAYGDNQLTALIAEALADSPTLAVAQARVRRAEASLEQAGAARRPSAGAKTSTSLSAQHFDADLPEGLSGIADQTLFARTSAGVQVDYQLDFFGKNRAAIAAATSKVEAETAEAASARLQLSTAVALTYADFARLAANRQAAQEAIRIRRETRGLVDQRLRAGIENEAAERQAQAELASAEADLAQVETRIARSRTALAALLGKGPDRGLAIAEPAAPSLAAIGLPADAGVDLMGRRPDLMAARLRAEAAGEKIAVARADFYPNVSLSASGSLQTLGVDALGGGLLGLGQFGPAVSLPIFSGGRLEGAYRGARADYDEAVALYNQALTRALSEVADAVGDRKGLERQLSRSREALSASEEAHRLMRLRYGQGLASYLDVLAVEGRLVAQRRTVADLEAQAFGLDVTLVRALGGGFAAA